MKTVNVEEIMQEIREQIGTEQAGQIDIEQIMEEIRENAARYEGEPIASFRETVGNADFSPAVIRAEGGVAPYTIYQQISNEAGYLKSHSQIPYYWEMGKGPKGLMKRVVRKLNKCLVLPMSEKQNEYNEHLANGIDAARIVAEQQDQRLNAEQQAIQQLQEQIAQLNQQIEQLNETIEYQRNELAKQGKELAEHGDELGRHGNDLAGHGDELAAHRNNLGQINQDIPSIRNKLTALDKSTDEIGMSVSRVIRYYLEGLTDGEQQNTPKAEDGPAADEPAVNENGNTYEGLDYFKFQNDFRGTQSEIMERQKQYLPYFRNRKGKVYDLGCGRGEFLRLLKEEKIPAFGMDTYAEYEVTGKLYDIDIRIGDGIAALEEMNEPLGGIFCAQVIEHLGFRTVEKLCRLAYEKLEEGACLILETPNPMCLSTMTNAFYLDPTHDKPVHPLLMEYLLKAIGFSDVQLVWPDHSLPQLPAIQSGAIDNLDEVNAAIARVSNMLFGSQDYAVIARK